MMAVRTALSQALTGVTVNLIDQTGTVIRTTTTSAGGYYLFDLLTPGSYIVEIAAANFDTTDADIDPLERYYSQHCDHLLAGTADGNRSR